MFDFILAHPYLTIWVSLVLVFERAMYCGYVVDDDSWFVVMKESKAAYKEKKLSLFRLILRGCYGAGIFMNKIQEHLCELILHGINCSLMYHLIAKSSIGPAGALLASMLYLINPINNQTVIWLNGRRYALTIMLVLTAFNFWWTAPAIAFIIPWFQVSGFLFPILFLWTPFWPLVPVLAALLSIFGKKHLISKMNDRKKDYKGGNENQKLTWRKSILYVKTVGYQFFNCIFPVNPAMYHNFLFYFSLTEEGTKSGYAINKDFWKGAGVLALLGYLIIFQHSFWAFWFLLFISPWCNIYQVTMNASDRYCSLPNIGAMALLAEYLLKLPDPFRTAAICSFAAFYILKYQPLFIAYRNLENFYLYHINQKPDIINPRFFLAKLYHAKKDHFSAFAVIKQGMRYHPYDFKLLLGFIECLFTLGKPISALRAMEICEKHIPPLEVEDTNNLFAGIRKQYAKEYKSLLNSRDEIDRMTPRELYEEKERIYKKESTLPLSKREKVLRKCGNLPMNRIANVA